MAVYAGFVGPSNTFRSPNVDAEDTINWIPTPTEPGVAKAPWVLLPTPGLSPWASTQDGPVTTLFQQDGRAFAISAAAFYELTINPDYPTDPDALPGLAVKIGDVASDGQPGTIVSNGTAGHQLFVVTGGLGYIFDLTSGDLSQITAESFTPTARMGIFLDGFFLALQANSIQFQTSQLFDGTLWNGLNVAQISQASDNIQAMVASHDEVWFFGSQTTAIWKTIGSGSPPLAPIPGVFIQQGVLAPFSAIAMANTVVWLGQSPQGTGVVFLAQGYTPKRVSTHAIEYFLNTSTQLDQAIAWSYEQEGHPFYVLMVPDLNASVVYDVATDLWHKRALWNVTTALWEQYVARSHGYAFGTHLVGDRQTGLIYQMSLDLYADDVA